MLVLCVCLWLYIRIVFTYSNLLVVLWGCVYFMNVLYIQSPPLLVRSWITTSQVDVHMCMCMFLEALQKCRVSLAGNLLPVVLQGGILACVYICACLANYLYEPLCMCGKCRGIQGVFYVWLEGGFTCAKAHTCTYVCACRHVCSTSTYDMCVQRPPMTCAFNVHIWHVCSTSTYDMCVQRPPMTCTFNVHLWHVRSTSIYGDVHLQIFA
jgi:hypothetical protein